VSKSGHFFKGLQKAKNESKKRREPRRFYKVEEQNEGLAQTAGA
jgi:hypothetical protein